MGAALPFRGVSTDGQSLCFRVFSIASWRSMMDWLCSMSLVFWSIIFSTNFPWPSMSVLMEGAHSLSETDCIHFPLFLPLQAFRRCDSVITTTCWAVWIGFTLILGVVLAAVTKHFFILAVSPDEHCISCGRCGLSPPCAAHSPR